MVLSWLSKWIIWGCEHSTYAARGEGGQAIVINFITVQGEGGVKKGQKLVYILCGPLADEKLCFQCNRKGRPQQMSDIDSKGGRSRKTEMDCTARFTVKTYEVVSDQYLAELENSGYSSAKYKETTHLMIGCLAHSHETENKKMYRYDFSENET